MVGNSLGPCVFLWPDVQNVLGVLPVPGLARREGGRKGGGRERGGKRKWRKGRKRGRKWTRKEEGEKEEVALLRKAVQTMCAYLPTLFHLS